MGFALKFRILGTMLQTVENEMFNFLRENIFFVFLCEGRQKIPAASKFGGRCDIAQFSRRRHNFSHILLNVESNLVHFEKWKNALDFQKFKFWLLWWKWENSYEFVIKYQILTNLQKSIKWRRQILSNFSLVLVN